MKSKIQSENSPKNSENKIQNGVSPRSLLILAGIVYVVLIVAASTIPKSVEPAATTTTTT